MEIALAVSDGVLQISITVAKPTINRDRVTSVDHRKPSVDLAESTGARHSCVTVHAVWKVHAFRRVAFKPAAGDSSRGCRIISLRQAVFVLTTRSTSQLSTCNSAST